MALLEVLDRHGVPYDKEEVGKRLDLFIKGLRRDPNFSKELEAFKKESPQKGGGDYDIPIPIKMSEGDFLGSEARWFVQVMGTPYAQVVVRLLFTVLFFLSAVENIPVIGNVIGAVLDVVITGGRMLIKTIQKMIPPMIGLIPLPYMSFVGMGLAAAVGVLLWPILAMISFSRQDFTSAIESFLRMIPPPMGDAIADAFLDANRTVYKLNEKRKKVAADVVKGLRAIMDVSKQTGTKIGEGAETLITKVREVASKPLPASMPKLPASMPKLPASMPKLPASMPKLPASMPKLPASMPKLPASMPKLPASMPKISLPTRRGGRFSRKPSRKNKWKTRRQIN